MRAIVLSIGLIGLSGDLAVADSIVTKGNSDPILIRTCTDDFKRCEVVISDRMISMPAAAIFQPDAQQGVSDEITSSVRPGKAPLHPAEEADPSPSDR